MFRNVKKMTNGWFYSNPYPLLRLFTVYVKGDMLIVLPLFIAIGFVGFFSVRFMVLLYAIFYSIRGFGEMMYWFMQQFGVKKYRPYDFGFKNLSNDAVYIFYQLLSLASTVIALGAMFWIILYWY